jgi:hypothetical protein
MSLIVTIEGIDPATSTSAKHTLSRFEKSSSILDSFLYESMKLTFEDKRVDNRGLRLRTSLTIEVLEDVLGSPEYEFTQAK